MRYLHVLTLTSAPNRHLIVPTLELTTHVVCPVLLTMTVISGMERSAPKTMGNVLCPRASVMTTASLLLLDVSTLDIITLPVVTATTILIALTTSVHRSVSLMEQIRSWEPAFLVVSEVLIVIISIKRGLSVLTFYAFYVPTIPNVNRIIRCKKRVTWNGMAIHKSLESVLPILITKGFMLLALF